MKVIVTETTTTIRPKYNVTIFDRQRMNFAPLYNVRFLWFHSHWKCERRKRVSTRDLTTCCWRIYDSHLYLYTLIHGISTTSSWHLYLRRAVPPLVTHFPPFFSSQNDERENQIQSYHTNYSQLRAATRHARETHIARTFHFRKQGPVDWNWSSLLSSDTQCHIPTNFLKSSQF